jgi:hypothetical protein
MKLFFLDDSRHRMCTRPGIPSLVAVGGIVVDATVARQLDKSINALCSQYGFPEREAFKWSPGVGLWMRDNLKDEKRDQFFIEVLKLAEESGVRGQVTISDPTMNPANQDMDDREMDVLLLSLERFNLVLGGPDTGLVIAARPSGGPKGDDKFLAACADRVAAGTRYADFGWLATNVLTMPYIHSRLLQVADLVVSITTTLVAGNIKYAETVFPSVKRLLLRSSSGRIGGFGVKIHPDFSYMNLYHWVLGDTENAGTALPSQKYRYFKDEMTL